MDDNSDTSYESIIADMAGESRDSGDFGNTDIDVHVRDRILVMRHDRVIAKSRFTKLHYELLWNIVYDGR